eukprot:3347897-Alexandrium_andersonii.AAC.1
MAGPTKNLAKGWELIRQSRLSADGERTPGLTMGDPTPFGRYLGCEHITGERVSPIRGKCVRMSTTCPNSWNSAL